MHPFYGFLPVDQCGRDIGTFVSVRKIKSVLAAVKNADLLFKVNIGNTQWKEAHRLARAFSVPSGDALHAILARDNVSILITRDAHFQRLSDICTIKKPEELV